MAGHEAYLGRAGSLGSQRVMAGPLSAKHPVRHIDLSLLGAALILAVIGCVAVYSATRPHLLAIHADPNYYLKRQLTYMALALIVLLITVMFDYRQLRTLAPLAYLGGLAGLLMVLTPAGQRSLGAQRWITVGILQIQPSEIMKLILILALAALWAERGTDDGGPKVLLAVALAAVPAGLVYLQPDLGTVLVLLFVAVTIMVVAGARLRWLGALAAGAAVVFFLALHVGLIHQYQLARITGFINQKSPAACQSSPNTPGCSAAYNLGQSKIAVSSGGLTGKGLLKGTQTNLDYVPENRTDFIFTVIGEETGFLGSLLVIGLLAFLIWRALRIAMLSRDQFGTRLAMGVAAMLAFQLFVNVGMTIGIVPIVGIPLPFISYGGSSLLTSFCAVGILMNIHMRRFV